MATATAAAAGTKANDAGNGNSCCYQQRPTVLAMATAAAAGDKEADDNVDGNHCYQQQRPTAMATATAAAASDKGRRQW